MPGATLHLSDEMNEGWRREGEGGGERNSRMLNFVRLHFEENLLLIPAFKRREGSQLVPIDKRATPLLYYRLSTQQKNRLRKFFSFLLLSSPSCLPHLVIRFRPFLAGYCVSLFLV